MARFLSDESGQGMVEYGLIIGLIAVVAIIGISAIGGNLKTMFNGIAGKLSVTE